MEANLEVLVGSATRNVSHGGPCPILIPKIIVRAEGLDVSVALKGDLMVLAVL